MTGRLPGPLFNSIDFPMNEIEQLVAKQLQIHNVLNLFGLSIDPDSGGTSE